jgi:hypothetical protein
MAIRNGFRVLTGFCNRLCRGVVSRPGTGPSEVTLRNEFGELLRVRRDGEKILVCHSDVDPAEFGVLSDVRIPASQAGGPEDDSHPEKMRAPSAFKPIFRPHLLFAHQRILLSNDEVVMIRDAGRHLV